MRQRSNLAQLQVRPVPDWCESDKLKDEIAKPKDCESDRNPVVTPKAVKTVNQGPAHRRKKHYQRVTTAKPQPAVNAEYGLPPLSKNWYWSNASQNITPTFHYSVTPSSSLTNESPMREKRPVNKQPATDQILNRDWPPIPAIEAIITIITHGEVTVARHRERLIRFRQILVTWPITAVRRSRRHHPFEAVALSLFAVDEKKWPIDAQHVARQACQSLNVKRGSSERIGANRRNIIGSEDENVAVVWLNKVIDAFIDKHLVARVDRAPGDNLAAMKKPTWKNVKILTERLGWGVYEKILPFTN